MVITPQRGQSATASVDLQVVDRVSATNVALSSNGGVASASSQYDEERAAAKANDGDPTTRWDSLEGGNRDAEWLQIQLAVPETIDKVVIEWEAAYADQYKIQTSIDGITWTDQAFIANGAGGT